jgi:hypothetical protein
MGAIDAGYDFGGEEDYQDVQIRSAQYSAGLAHEKVEKLEEMVLILGKHFAPTMSDEDQAYFYAFAGMKELASTKATKAVESFIQKKEHYAALRVAAKLPEYLDTKLVSKAYTEGFKHYMETTNLYDGHGFRHVTNSSNITEHLEKEDIKEIYDITKKYVLGELKKGVESLKPGNRLAYSILYTAMDALPHDSKSELIVECINENQDISKQIKKEIFDIFVYKNKYEFVYDHVKKRSEKKARGY